MIFMGVGRLSLTVILLDPQRFQQQFEDQGQGRRCTQALYELLSMEGQSTQRCYSSPSVHRAIHPSEIAPDQQNPHYARGYSIRMMSPPGPSQRIRPVSHRASRRANAGGPRLLPARPWVSRWSKQQEFPPSSWWPVPGLWCRCWPSVPRRPRPS